MKYINLTLKEHNQHNGKSYLLEDTIQKHETVVLLGAPGSGKTSILRKYESEHLDSQYLTVKEILKFNDQVKEETKVLLLDGLDEYRSAPGVDKAFVVTELGNNVKKYYLKGAKVVISCREMDWYGEVDTNKLKDEINKEAVIFSVCPLDSNQKNQMAELLDIKEPQEFIEKFSKYGFLDNPQMFVMLADIYKTSPEEAIKSKTDLYLIFVKMAREHNPAYKLNKTNELEADEILKYTGYISFFYLFSNVEILNEGFLDEICDADHGYPKEKLEIVLKSKLFEERKFIHRTIAEFTLAYYIYKYKLEKDKLIAVERVQSLFVKKGKVPTVLRGTYAWLCSLTGSEELIKVDPYYQAIHGDNSLFDNDLKKKIVLEVKKHAKKNPYFFEFGQTMELEGFYNEKLDSFLIKEFDEALNFKNHYIYFIINAIISTPELSHGMKEFLKEKILDNTIQGYYKRDIIKAFQDNIVFLIDILDRIKNDELPDDSDTFKDTLLRILYPDHIGFDKIADYLILYKKRVGGYCYYLLNTDYENKYTLIDNIYKLSYDKTREPHLSLPENTELFIREYFLETLLKYENGLTAKDIYGIIKHFKKYYERYDSLKFNSYRHGVTDELKNSDEKLTSLANELFSLFIDDMLKESNKDIGIYTFHNFFNYKSPNKQSKILLEKMDLTKKKDINNNLFLYALRYLQKDELNSDKLKSIAKEFGFEQELYDWQNPKKLKWEIEDEIRKKKIEEKEKKLLTDNEKYFSGKTDDQIQKFFGDLHYVANLLFIEDSSEKEEYLTNKTLERLRNILKTAITNKLLKPELLTLESLATDSPKANRNIDYMYYVSCALNDCSDIKIPNEDFLKYLYINTLIHSSSSNVIKGNLIEIIETTRGDFARAALKEFIELLIEAHLSMVKQNILSFTETEDNIDNLKKIVLLFSPDKDTIQDIILNNFLKVYNFALKLEDLISFNELTKVNEKNKIIILALKTLLENDKKAFTVNMAISIHSLFEYELERFNQLTSDNKVKIIEYMMSQFNTEESISHFNGWQSPKSMCASFLRDKALNLLGLTSLQKLQETRKDEDDIWSYRIAYTIDKRNQEESDQLYMACSVEKIKKYIQSDSIISKEDFFTEVYLRLKKLRGVIEANRDNDKETFFSQNKDHTPKTEEACRDEIFLRLQDKYDDLMLTKEKHEADNRVDINIKYIKDLSYEVQVECKKDKNPDINNGISEQLIGKYFSSGVKYGIYLIFYFGAKKDKDRLVQKVNMDIPEKYKNNINVICIDFTHA